jgi:hypothetical protein
MKNKYFLESTVIIAIIYLLTGFVFWDLDARNWGPFARFTLALIALLFCCGVFENSENPNKDEN